MNRKRIVITGMGVISPVGNEVNEFFENVKNGIHGFNYIESFDTEKYKAKIAGEVKNFKPEDYMEKKEARRMDRFCHFAVAASSEAVKMSGLNIESVDSDKFGVIIGTGIGGFLTIEREHKVLLERGPGRVSPFLIPMIIGNMAAGLVSMKFGAKYISSCSVTACASSANSIGDAYKLMVNNDVDVMIAGGAEAGITPLGMAGFISLTALSTSNDLNRCSIPFDKERDGFVMGEGAGILVLETLEHAMKRNAKIYGEIVGYGYSSDAYHITSPDPEGAGASKAMDMAIKDAGISKEEVSYINAHGTATPVNDKYETLAIKNTFKEHAYNVSISSTKSVMGHLLGAAGAVESIVCIKSTMENIIPPTASYKVKDEECDLDYTPNKFVSKEVKYALTNSLGFGGHNASLLFKKWEG